MNEQNSLRKPMTAMIAVLLLLVLVGCGAEGDENAAETATIAPATPEPNVNLEDDPALTQTIEPGENRSPYEGGPLEEDEVVGGETETNQERD